PPFRVDKEDAIRIGKSSVTIDLLVREYEGGMSSEEISGSRRSLVLADVYSALAYYLRYRKEIKAYLARRQKQRTLSNPRLQQLAKKHKPSQTWYDENLEGLY